MTDKDILFNLKDEIDAIAMPKDACISTINNSAAPVQSKAIKTELEQYVKTSVLTTKLAEYLTQAEIESLYLTEDDLGDYAKQTDLAPYIKTTDADTKYAPKQHDHPDLIFNMYANPVPTTLTVDNLLEPGYWQYTGLTGANFRCGPKIIDYKNGYIRVEKQANYFIQHVYATKQTASNELHIDGSEYMRTGHIPTESEIPIWNEWQVKHIPYTNCTEELLKTVDDDANLTFEIWENTAGYIFKWRQKGEDNKYLLPMSQNVYHTIATFKKLPIVEPCIFGNLIGHVDVKITKDAFKVRSVNNKGDYIVGVDNTFFVPRTN